jgi:hypothetical protein
MMDGKPVEKKAETKEKVTKKSDPKPLSRPQDEEW